MGKPVKRKKKYNYSKDRKKAWKKSKKPVKIACSQIANAYDEKKSLDQNMLDMGLSVDPNKTIRIPRTTDDLKSTTLETKVGHSSRGSKGHVAKALEAEANTPQQRRVRLSEPDVQFCTYMMEKYGEDYKAMARDMRNHYQETPKQIRKKIATFKSIPEQYSIYLAKKDGPCQI